MDDAQREAESSELLSDIGMDHLDAGAARRHVVAELGLAAWLEGSELHGSAEVVPEMHVPGTQCLRTSILACWADVLTGLLVTDIVTPRVPVTLELAIDLPRPAHALGRINAAGRILKAGRSVIVAEAEFTADGSEERIAVCTASFTPARDTSLTLPSLLDTLHLHHRGEGRLSAPFAERAYCRRLGDGVAALPRTDESINASNTINGGLIALVVEEAALAGTAAGTSLSSLAIRYVRPARVGPIVATATRHGELARVDVRDTGSDDRLVVTATTRAFHPRAIRSAVHE